MVRRIKESVDVLSRNLIRLGVRIEVGKIKRFVRNTLNVRIRKL